MSRIRIVLILTENWTMRPTPDVADLVTPWPSPLVLLSAALDRP